MSLYFWSVVSIAVSTLPRMVMNPSQVFQSILLSEEMIFVCLTDINTNNHSDRAVFTVTVQRRWVHGHR